MAQSQVFLENLILPYSQINDEEYDVSKNRAYQKIMSLFDVEAKGLNLAGHTKWGMLNAVTEYVDHHSPSRTNDSRLDNAWFGKGESMKAKALQLLTM
jgi:hypothetical protein